MTGIPPKTTQQSPPRKALRGKRVAILFHRIGPYHFARLSAAGRLLEIHAVELSGADERYAWDPIEGTDSFERQTLFIGADSNTQSAGEVARRVRIALDQCQPAVVVVNGWSDPGALSALEWCAGSGTPAVMLSESTAIDEPRSPWKEWIKRHVVRLCSAGLVGGTPHAEYLSRLGIQRSRIFMGYDAVDNEYFSTKAEESQKHKTELRKHHGLPEKYFLASARFVEKKNLARLLQAYALYRQRVSASSSSMAAKEGGWSLVLLGDGPLNSTLKTQLSTLNLHDHVQMPGFVQYPNLPAYYGLASAFLHPSTTEQWGLVVNEAMAAGLPVLVSNRCGCAKDLVQEGVNGFTFDAFNVDQMVDLMLKLSASNFPLSAFGAESRRLIASWGPDRFATGLRGAVEAALSTPPPKANLADRLLRNVLLRRKLPTDA